MPADDEAAGWSVISHPEYDEHMLRAYGRVLKRAWNDGDIAAWLRGYDAEVRFVGEHPAARPILAEAVGQTPALRRGGFGRWHLLYDVHDEAAVVRLLYLLPSTRNTDGATYPRRFDPL